MIAAPLVGPDRWHYRRSLASRVTLLTTMAVGLAVTLVALGAYLTVRMQLQASLDDSLVHRAQTTSAAIGQADALTQAGLTPIAVNASDVRIGSIREDGLVNFTDSGDVIFDRVWGYDFGPASNSLEVYVGYLRRKTEAEGEPRLVQTVRGIGYVLRSASR